MEEPASLLVWEQLRMPISQPEAALGEELWARAGSALAVTLSRNCSQLSDDLGQRSDSPCNENRMITNAGSQHQVGFWAWCFNLIERCAEGAQMSVYLQLSREKRAAQLSKLASCVSFCPGL